MVVAGKPNYNGEKRMFRKLLATVAAVSLAAPAMAATFTLTNGATFGVPAWGGPGTTTGNDFSSDLATLGFTQYTTTGATLSVIANAGEGWAIDFFFYGSESGNSDSITTPGGTFTENTLKTNWIGGAGQALTQLTFTGIGTTSITSQINFTCVGGNCASAGVGSDGFGFFTGPRIASSGLSTVWLGYDDQITQQDDNHDDLVLRATIRAVPEPATWAMMIGGMGIAGTALRRRRRNAVAQVLA